MDIEDAKLAAFSAAVDEYRRRLQEARRPRGIVAFVRRLKAACTKRRPESLKLAAYKKKVDEFEKRVEAYAKLNADSKKAQQDFP